jgi:hypothetical protein
LAAAFAAGLAAAFEVTLATGLELAFAVGSGMLLTALLAGAFAVVAFLATVFDDFAMVFGGVRFRLMELS